MHLFRLIGEGFDANALSFSFKIFHSVETAAVFHLANDHPNVRLGRRILLGILLAMRDPICAEFEFHVVGEQCSAHVGHSTIRQVSYSVIIIKLRCIRES